MKLILNLIIGLILSLNIFNTENGLTEKKSLTNNDKKTANCIDEHLQVLTDKELPKIVSVSVTSTLNNYKFNVGVSSPDIGCEQYANWWEIVSEDGDLLYRRILAHSHVKEQPFIRLGNVKNIKPDQLLIVRAHMNNMGYGIQAYKGSIINGFKAIELETNFAKELETQSPQPKICLF